MTEDILFKKVRRKKTGDIKTITEVDATIYRSEHDLNNPWVVISDDDGSFWYAATLNNVMEDWEILD